MIETEHLTIRTFEPGDLDAYQRISRKAFGPESGFEMESWIAWSALSAEWLPQMHQPPTATGRSPVRLKDARRRE